MQMRRVQAVISPLFDPSSAGAGDINQSRPAIHQSRQALNAREASDSLISNYSLAPRVLAPYILLQANGFVSTCNCTAAARTSFSSSYGLPPQANAIALQQLQHQESLRKARPTANSRGESSLSACCCWGEPAGLGHQRRSRYRHHRASESRSGGRSCWQRWWRDRVCPY